MFDWWSRMSLRYSSDGEGSQIDHKQPHGLSINIGNQRRVKTQQFVEVIGGCHSGPMIMKNTPNDWERRLVVTGPPRLPRELLVQIVHLACESRIEEHKENRTSAAEDLLSLARIDRSMHEYVFSNFILRSLRLRGARQIHAFANSSVCRGMAKKVRRLYILRPEPKTEHGHNVFNDAEELERFQRMIHLPMQEILKHCTELEHLALEVTAVALDVRWKKHEKRSGVMLLSENLKELTTMLSIYGGELNEKLFDNTYGNRNLQTNRWANLTHLQLLGPRLRINSLTVLGICELPQLTHLALAMPWIVHTTMNITGISPDLLKRHAKTIERATDLTGRESVLQLLYSGLGDRLKSLYLICHDINDYVGNVKNLGPWFRALQWHEYPAINSHDEERSQSPTPTVISNTELRLITISLGRKEREVIDPHPTTIGYWMMQRVVKEKHWNFEDGEKDTFDGRDVSISVESWKAPSISAKNKVSPSYSPEPFSSSDGRATTYYIHQNTPSSSSRIADIIDNLD